MGAISEKLEQTGNIAFFVVDHEERLDVLSRH